MTDGESWAAALLRAIHEVAAEGGGRVLIHRGGPGCGVDASGSCPCNPQILVVNKDGTAE